MINRIWAFFIIVGVLYGLFIGNIEIINNEIINSARTALEMFLTIMPIITLWVGIMAIAKESGLLDKLANLLSPILLFYFQKYQRIMNH